MNVILCLILPQLCLVRKMIVIFTKNNYNHTGETKNYGLGRDPKAKTFIFSFKSCCFGQNMNFRPIYNHEESAELDNLSEYRGLGRV